MSILLILFFLILLSGLFSMAEIAIVSSRKVRLHKLAEENKPGAKTALDLAEEPTRFLSTVQIGITSISILSGVFGEASISKLFRTYLENIPFLASHAKPLALIFMVVFITALSLLFGELLPKRLAMQNPEKIAIIISRPMQFLSRLTAPLVRILSFSTDALLRLFGAYKNNSPSITEEEIRVLMEQGADEGVFDRAEQELVENIFRLDERKISAIMTVRQDVIFLDVEESEQHNRELLQSSLYSRFPVCKGGLDNIIGMTSAKKLLNRNLSNQPFDLLRDLQAPLYVPATLTPKQLIEQFKNSHEHIALIVDEYGELEGLVTINDMLEAIIGYLATEDVIDEKSIVQREDGSYLVDGMLELERLKSFFAIKDLMPGESSGNINTLGGFIMHQLGRVPLVGEHFFWHKWRFEVVDMDRSRVDKVLINAIQKAENLKSSKLTNEE